MFTLPPSQVLDVARKVVSIFESRGLKCCLMGSVASYLYGVSRAPNDVDMVVLSIDYTQEDLKAMLVQSDPHFTLVRSRNPRATYRVLWYRIPNTYKRCKVDILIPGVLNVPDLPPNSVVTNARYNLPIMPLIPQLLLKLQGWSDHRASTRTDMQLKQYLDVRDIDALLDIVCNKGARIDDPEWHWVPDAMVADAQSTLKTYLVLASPQSVYNWRKAGFSVSQPTSSKALVLEESDFN
ncbi:hypothetical protein C8Q79DRAFT_337305 [Trametes meyenii]|nr:hypothetical protein C8Q79DRAFT_337305 [Trametes meyenii]